MPLHGNRCDNNWAQLGAVFLELNDARPFGHINVASCQTLWTGTFVFNLQEDVTVFAPARAPIETPSIYTSSIFACGGRSTFSLF